MASKMNVTIGLLTTMLLLGVADAALIEGLPMQLTSDVPDETQEPDTAYIPDTTKPTSVSGGVRRNQGVDVEALLSVQDFKTTEAREAILLDRIVPKEEATLQSYVLLKDGDRAGLIAWTHSSNVKQYYLVLKEALHSAFTADVRDLLDETQRREGRPTRNLLTFYDPGLVPERVVFIRVRERLYEFHVTEGSSDDIFNLIEELTK